MVGPRDVTELLDDLAAGSEDALEALMERVYDDLHRVAEGHLRRVPGDARGRVLLQPTMLVNESFLRLVDQRNGFHNRAQFFALASRLILRVLLDHARRQEAERRGGDRRRITLHGELLPSTPEEDPLADPEALAGALERLAALDARKAEVVRLRFLAGLSIAEAARALGVSEATVERDWSFSRAWLGRELERGAG